MWIGSNSSVSDPTNIIVKDFARKHPSLVMSDPSVCLGNTFSGRTSLKLLVQNREINHEKNRKLQNLVSLGLCRGWVSL